MSKNNLLTAFISRKRQQRENARLLEVRTPNGIAESGYVEIGGIAQWVSVRGKDKNNPVLLFIHGGPGSPYSIFSPLLRTWEADFTLVQWDQRGSGKTFGKTGKTGSGYLSFERLAEDGIELAEYLCHKLQQEKIFLVGSSAGSLSALKMAKQRPDLFWAYIGTDQNAPDPRHLSYQLTLEAFQATGNAKGVRLLEKIGSDPANYTRPDFAKLNQYIVKSIRGVPNMITDLILPAMLSSPEHRLKDIFDIIKGMKFSLEHLFDELVAFDFESVGRRFELPFFILHGDNDIITPTVTAQNYFAQIEAPYKEFVLIEQAGHLACFARPEQFRQELLKRVRPLAFRADKLALS
jgi:pimeloyl-ACP methyl ester carboxylesterase